MLVAARPPLVAFNLELAPPATLEDARRIAALVREGGAEGLPGVRAIGLELDHRGGVAQVSVNVEDHRAVPLARLLDAVSRHADVTEAELVGLAPRAAFDGWPGGRRRPQPGDDRGRAPRPKRDRLAPRFSDPGRRPGRFTGVTQPPRSCLTMRKPFVLITALLAALVAGAPGGG